MLEARRRREGADGEVQGLLQGALRGGREPRRVQGGGGALRRLERPLLRRLVRETEKEAHDKHAQRERKSARPAHASAVRLGTPPPYFYRNSPSRYPDLSTLAHCLFFASPWPYRRPRA